MPYLLSIFIAFSSIFIHDYHFGLTEIHFNKEAKSIQTGIRVFTDDLDRGISEAYGTKLRLDTNRELENSDAYISQYLQENIQFIVNNKELPYEYIGKEYVDDATWMYVEIKKVKKIKSFSFRNTLLFETFDDQKHIINANLNGKIKSKTLKKGRPTYKATL